MGKRADAVSLVPMQFNSPKSAVRKPNGRHTFAFAPSTAAIDLSKQRANLDAATRRDGFRLFDLANDLELHSLNSRRPASCWQVRLTFRFSGAASRFHGGGCKRLLGRSSLSPEFQDRHVALFVEPENIVMTAPQQLSDVFGAAVAEANPNELRRGATQEREAVKVVVLADQ
jgi:hypothetical protein